MAKFSIEASRVRIWFSYKIIMIYNIILLNNH